MFTLEEKSREWERRHPQYTPKATPEDEKRYREMELAANIAWLQQRIAELDAELDATGLEDALDWERFPELEKLLYALAERVAEQRKIQREREVDAAYAEFELWDEWDETDFEYGDELDDEQLVELVEQAEEAAMDELAVFGSIAILDADDFEECGEFARCDVYIHALEEDFATGRVGGAEVYEYEECMRDFRELMSRG